MIRDGAALFICMYIYWIDIPKGSNVVPLGLGPIFFLGIIIYCPKRNYIGASGHTYMSMYIW